MNIILVPTDFSYCALQAVRTAVNLAIITKAKLILHHTIYSETNWMSLSAKERAKFPETLARISDSEQRMKSITNSKMFSNVNWSAQITFGVPYEEIVYYAKKQKADLIVIGTHGNEPSERYFIGSTVQKVLREAPCPVMTVPNENSNKRWRKLVFATNFDKDVYKPFEKIRQMAKDLGATINLVYINQPGEFLDTRAINSLMDSFAVRYPELRFNKVIYNHKDVDEGLLQYIEDNPMNWVALVTQRRVGKSSYLIGYTETLAFKSKLPVLSINVLPVPLK